MCKFFSCLSDGRGNIYYFGRKDRKLLRAGKITNFAVYSNPDSHTTIAAYHRITPQQEANYNRWEFDPHTSRLRLDTAGDCNNDAVQVELKVKKINLKHLDKDKFLEGSEGWDSTLSRIPGISSTLNKWLAFMEPMLLRLNFCLGTYGLKVQVITNNPTYGWSSIARGNYGILIDPDYGYGDSKVWKVNFATAKYPNRHAAWQGLASEFRICFTLHNVWLLTKKLLGLCK